jgi:wyosine [tRNA(Phe)-imidazoG37] synthetase (radical SAM superfamily)
MSDGPVKRFRVPLFADHSRDWRDNLYVYPVISRRSRGLSVGVNLNPDAACNFDCIYCQVDRTQPVKVRHVDLERLGGELDRMLGWAADGSIFEHPAFSGVPTELRRVNDIAFSGDGEPTTCPVFADSVAPVAELKAAHGLADVKIVLITDACYLTRPAVVRGLAIMDANQGEIWAKLDAGTEEYFALVNRPNFPLSHVMENIIAAARGRPVCIQSLFMEIRGQAPTEVEIAAYVARLNEVTAAGGRVQLVQVYTTARQPAEAYVRPLPDIAVAAIAERVRRETGLPTAAFYAA